MMKASVFMAALLHNVGSRSDEESLEVINKLGAAAAKIATDAMYIITHKVTMRKKMYRQFFNIAKAERLWLRAIKNMWDRNGYIKVDLYNAVNNSLHAMFCLRKYDHHKIWIKLEKIQDVLLNINTYRQNLTSEGILKYPSTYNTLPQPVWFGLFDVERRKKKRALRWMKLQIKWLKRTGKWVEPMSDEFSLIF
uniref:Uncharacterized protein n=1 Tax=Clastoptera arizonana TaxID=38151 RepID=A0A1B6CA01_9HEMI